MGKGTPVALLHSSMSSKLQWYGLMHLLKSEYLVIALDMYGEGDSPWPEKTENFGLSDEVQFVESILDDIIPHDEPVFLVGHSYGGAVALRYAYENYDRGRIRGLALFEPVCFSLLPESEEALARVRHTQEIVQGFLDKGEKEAAARHFVDRWSSKGTFDGFPDVFREALLKGVDKLQLSRPALMRDTMTLEDCRHMHFPVMLMAGRQSRLEAHRVADLLKDNLPECEMRWFKGGHMAPVHEAREVNAVIVDFFRRHL
jgi:pimeloyl-ACP methyl ester carboxylesterase